MAETEAPYSANGLHETVARAPPRSQHQKV